MGKKAKNKTQIKKKTLNPEFNEVRAEKTHSINKYTIFMTVFKNYSESAFLRLRNKTMLKISFSDIRKMLMEQ